LREGHAGGDPEQNVQRECHAKTQAEVQRRTNFRERGTRHALHDLQKGHGVCAINIEGFPLPSARHFVHPASKKLSPLALAFKQHLLEVVSGRYWNRSAI